MKKTGVWKRRTRDQNNNNNNNNVWTKKEDDNLKLGVVMYGDRAWTKISAGLVRSKGPTKCRDRWLNHLDPILKEAWTPAEDQLLLELAKVHAHQWATIGNLIGRPAQTCYEHHHRIGRKKPPTNLGVGEADPKPPTGVPTIKPEEVEELTVLLEEADKRAKRHAKSRAKRQAREKRLEELRRFAVLKRTPPNGPKDLPRGSTSREKLEDDITQEQMKEAYRMVEEEAKCGNPTNALGQKERNEVYRLIDEEATQPVVYKPYLQALSQYQELHLPQNELQKSRAEKLWFEIEKANGEVEKGRQDLKNLQELLRKERVAGSDAVSKRIEDVRRAKELEETLTKRYEDLLGELDRAGAL